MATNKNYKKGVLWDIDGTLILSEPLHEKAVIRTLDSMNITNYKEKLRIFGNTWEQMWASIEGEPEGLDEFERRIREYYTKHVATLQKRSRAVDVLIALNKAGIKQGAVSNSKACISHANLEHLGIKNIMDTIVTGDDFKRGKPDAEPYLIAAERMGIFTKDCIVIEDSPTGAQAGIAANAYTIFWPEKVGMESKYCDQKISNIYDVNWKDLLGIDIGNVAKFN